MEIGDNVEFGGFVVSRVWLTQKKGGANFNAHEKWAKVGEGERAVLLGNLNKDKKHDEAASGRGRRRVLHAIAVTAPEFTSLC